MLRVKEKAIAVDLELTYQYPLTNFLFQTSEAVVAAWTGLENTTFTSVNLPVTNY